MFIMTKGGYLNTSLIAEIKHAKRKEQDVHEAFDSEGRSLGVLGHSQDIVIQLLPAVDWQICYGMSGFDDNDHALAYEPLVAFGLTVFGFVVPITSDLEPIFDLRMNGFYYGLKFRDRPTIHCPQNCSYDDEKKFLEDFIASKKKK